MKRLAILGTAAVAAGLAVATACTSDVVLGARDAGDGGRSTLDSALVDGPGGEDAGPVDGSAAPDLLPSPDGAMADGAGFD